VKEVRAEVKRFTRKAGVAQPGARAGVKGVASSAEWMEKVDRWK